MRRMPLPALVAVALVAAVVLGVAAGFGATGVARTFEQLAGAVSEKSASVEKGAHAHAASGKDSGAAHEVRGGREKSEGDAMAGGSELVNVENLQAERASASSIELTWDQRLGLRGRAPCRRLRCVGGRGAHRCCGRRGRGRCLDRRARFRRASAVLLPRARSGARVSGREARLKRRRGHPRLQPARLPRSRALRRVQRGTRRREPLLRGRLYARGGPGAA